MAQTVLITGGAGFIGCAIAPALADVVDRVVAFDNLHPQVHARQERPADLDDRVDFVRGNVTAASDWDRLLADVRPDIVVHLAAETGTGQSLTEATRHAHVNLVGLTEMLDAFVRNDVLPERIVLTSSRAVYGEGAWADGNEIVDYPGQRSAVMLKSGTWDYPGKHPLPFSSDRIVAHPTSVYGATKLAQENVLTAWCLAMNVTPVLFRLQNVYGPGQSLSNPYTGIVSFFAQQARAGKVIPVYEDGQIVRDFVFITDVATAIVQGALHSGARTVPYDIGSGVGTTVLELARLIAARYEAPEPVVTGQYRNGDVRAASADISTTLAALDWSPQVSVSDGVELLCSWIDAGAPSLAPTRR
jgi:dTDP-L-rhamnose 4-epimerase